VRAGVQKRKNFEGRMSKDEKRIVMAAPQIPFIFSRGEFYQIAKLLAIFWSGLLIVHAVNKLRAL
jgi:hypothetical protein